MSNIKVIDVEIFDVNEVAAKKMKEDILPDFWR